MDLHTRFLFGICVALSLAGWVGGQDEELVNSCECHACMYCIQEDMQCWIFAFFFCKLQLYGSSKLESSANDMGIHANIIINTSMHYTGVNNGFLVAN